jgi:hypothetical protein
MSDFLTTNPEHGGVTDEMMERFFADHPDMAPLPSVNPSAQSTPETELEQPPSSPQAPQEGEPEATPEPAAPEPPSEPPSEPPDAGDFLELDGTRYPRSQIQAAADFQRHLTSDPQLQRLITDYLTATPAPPQQVAPQVAPASPSSEVPPELDMEDPSMRALYTLIQRNNEQINNQIAQLSQGVNTTYEQSMAAQRQQIDAQYHTASASFAKDHSLGDDEVEQLSQVAARLGVLPSLMQGIDPITGSPTSPDPIRAFSRALEIAMYQVPEYRDREFRRSVETMQQEAQKKKLLGAVGGSSGSVARTTAPPQPGSPESKRAMLAEVGAMLNGEWSDPTAN